ncbi:3-phenylpropionate MFS transporter [Skermanella pratensis]|uniref:3-phenylpropionate MFS transporter n=1 Tax=Skermanella pratensis TaxID=2233999 RepID=UPI0013018B74|nr:3-phenylpropionate MFS transporter [Skermanella pratensis]
MLLPLRLSLFYAAYFLILGIQLPFWPVWLESRGLSAGEIGTVLAVALWVRIVTIPVAGVVVDRTGNRRTALILLSAAALAASLLYLPADGFVPILLVTVLMSAGFSPIMNIGDNLTLLIARAHRLDYGRMRLWGSISFIAAASLGGIVVADSRPEVVLHLLIGAMALTALSCWLAPKPPPREPGRTEVPLKTSRIAALLRDPGFLLFLGATSAVQSSHAVYYAFGTLHWRGLGHSEAVIGWLWAEGVIAEILLFAFGGAVTARLGPARLLMLAGLAGLVRWSGTAMAEGVAVLALLQVLHGMTFGAAHLAAMQYIAKAVPLDRSATAQALYGALATGMGTALAMMLAGAAYAGMGAGAYHAMAALGLAGAVFALLLGSRDRRDEVRRADA